MTPNGRENPSGGTVKPGLGYARICSYFFKASVGICNVPLQGPVSALPVWGALSVSYGHYKRPHLLALSTGESPSPMPSMDLYTGSSPGKFLIVYSSKSIMPGNKQFSMSHKLNGEDAYLNFLHDQHGGFCTICG